MEHRKVSLVTTALTWHPLGQQSSNFLASRDLSVMFLNLDFSSVILNWDRDKFKKVILGPAIGVTQAHSGTCTSSALPNCSYTPVGVSGCVDCHGNRPGTRQEGQMYRCGQRYPSIGEKIQDVFNLQLVNSEACIRVPGPIYSSQWKNSHLLYPTSTVHILRLTLQNLSIENSHLYT